MSEEQYWRRPVELELNRFRAFGEDCKAIIKKAKEQKIRVRNVEITDEIVRFDCYETFYIDRILDLKAHENPLGEGVLVQRVIISNDPDYKYPDSQVTIGEGTEAKDYYLQTVRTNWEDNRVVVIACIIALKHRFPDVWIDSDTIDHEFEVIDQATKLAVQSYEARKDKVVSEDDGTERDMWLNPYYIFASLKPCITDHLKKLVAEDGVKLQKIVGLAAQRRAKFYTDEFQEKVAKQLGYTSIGEITQLVDIEGHEIPIKVRMIMKTEGDLELCIGYDNQGQILASMKNLVK